MIGHLTVNTELAFKMPMWLLGFTGVVVLVICALASLISMRKVIKLEPSTYLHIRGDRSSWERHQETWTGHAKRFLGRLWARIDRSSRDPDAGVQGGGGVRG